VDARRLDADELGQIPVAEAVEASTPDQHKRVLEQLLTDGLRFHEVSLST
jgi:hypothetical protein